MRRAKKKATNVQKVKPLTLTPEIVELIGDEKQSGGRQNKERDREWAPQLS